MRVTLAILLIFGILAGVHSQDDEDAPVGTEDNPYPEGEGGEDEEGAEGEEGDEEEGDEEEPQLSSYEDKGETVTEAHLRTLHKKMDGNKDGKVSTQEVMDYAAVARKSNVAKEIAGIFDEIPSTADGHLSLEEHMEEQAEFHADLTEEEKAHQKKAELAKFKAADVNNDGKLDKEELSFLMHPDQHPEVLELHANEEMRKRDTNKDGKLSKDEWIVDATPGEHQAHNPDHEHDPHGDFESLDEDKSGFISLDELRHWESGQFHSNDAINKLIKSADKDHDGLMSEHELAGIVNDLDGHEAHPHLMDWVFHEEL